MESAGELLQRKAHLAHPAAQQARLLHSNQLVGLTHSRSSCSSRPLPPSLRLSDLFHRLFPSDQVEAARSISTSYKAQTRKLDAEFDVLLERYQVLAAALGLAGPGQQAGQQGGSGRRLLEGGTSDDAGKGIGGIGDGGEGSVPTGSVLHGRSAGAAGRGQVNSMRLQFEPTHAGRVPASLTAGAASSSSGGRDGEDVMIRLDEVAGQIKVRPA